MLEDTAYIYCVPSHQLISFGSPNSQLLTGGWARGITCLSVPCFLFVFSCKAFLSLILSSNRAPRQLMNVNNCYMLSEKMVFFSMILTSYQVSLLFAITQAGEGGEWGGRTTLYVVKVVCQLHNTRHGEGGGQERIINSEGVKTVIPTQWRPSFSMVGNAPYFNIVVTETESY